ncbi:vWA domain-containing protein [Alteromonas flava]|uniref:vWA domain-containing protein n=1 Tax=Alteromonas flava TaxID=2048003 RepID=UPI000C2888C4|nr:VWA domain-containing protein [Alteromonas flava]
MMELLTEFNWQDFHFIRPQWLWALLPLAVIYIALVTLYRQLSGWQQVLPTHLQAVILSDAGGTRKSRRPPFWLLALAWLLAVIMLAGPTWERLPQPVFNLKQGNVLVLDMSLSMRSTDIAPDRVTRARFKAIDLVSQLGDGEVGMVAYAGDAFVISPLTEDVNNLIAMIPSISPEIMPIPGSSPLRGFEVATELLQNAGYQQGNIFWFTDGMEQQQFKLIAEFVENSPYTIHALAIGTQEGAPIRQVNGELLKDSQGAIVVPRMDPSKIRAVSARSGGDFARLSANDSDIQQLVQAGGSYADGQLLTEDDNPMQGDVWRDMGAYLVVLLLPFAAYAFRRGIIMCVPLLGLGFLVPPPAAFASTESASPNWLTSAFATADQRGQDAYASEDFSRAADLFNDPMWQGAAHYRNQNYEQALAAYSQVDSTAALYNQGNALAKLGRLEEAIEKYTQVLAREPENQAAQENKALLEELLQQQDQQNQQESPSSQEQDGQDQQQQSNADNQSGGDGEQQDEANQSQGDNSQDAQQQSQSSSEQQSQEPENESEQSAENSSSSDAQQAPMRDQEPVPEQSESSTGETDQPQPESSTSPPDAQGGEQDAKLDQQETQAAQAREEALTDEEKEQLQRMQTLLRKIPDDPAFLLQRKMQLESQQRRRERAPPNQATEW